MFSSNQILVLDYLNQQTISFMFCILAQNGSSGASDESGNPHWLASSDISLGVFYPFKIKKNKKDYLYLPLKVPELPTQTTLTSLSTQDMEVVYVQDKRSAIMKSLPNNHLGKLSHSSWNIPQISEKGSGLVPLSLKILRLYSWLDCKQLHNFQIIYISI